MASDRNGQEFFDTYDQTIVGMCESSRTSTYQVPITIDHEVRTIDHQVRQFGQISSERNSGIPVYRMTGEPLGPPWVQPCPGQAADGKRMSCEQANLGRAIRGDFLVRNRPTYVPQEQSVNAT